MQHAGSFMHVECMTLCHTSSKKALILDQELIYEFSPWCECTLSWCIYTTVTTQFIIHLTTQTMMMQPLQEYVHQQQECFYIWVPHNVADQAGGIVISSKKRLSTISIWVTGKWNNTINKQLCWLVQHHRPQARKAGSPCRDVWMNSTNFKRWILSNPFGSAGLGTSSWHLPLGLALVSLTMV